MEILGLSLSLISNTINAEIIRIPIESGPNGAVTINTNISNDGSEHRMDSVVGGFSSTSGHRTNAAINLKKKTDGTINYTHKNPNGTVTFDTNISSEETVPQMNSVGGGFSSTSGHRANAAINLKKDDAYILSQQDLLSNRLNHIFKILLEKYESGIDTFKGDELNVLTQKLQDLAIVIFKLDVEGLRVSKFINNFVDQQQEQIQEQSKKGLNNRGNSESIPRLIYNSTTEVSEKSDSNDGYDDRSGSQPSTESTTDSGTDSRTDSDKESVFPRDMVESEETF